MANLTDPLANPVHGTNPQNLIDYITRQKIYSTTFWKEECFGLNAQDIAAKAATRVNCLGGSYGGNSQPCRFLCMVLKMLQIGIDDDILEEFIQNEDFKYVRLMGMFYLRLTARPADIYERLEPFYADYRKIRHRLTNGWEVIHVDEYVHTLLSQNEMCGIAFPRLPKRTTLEEAGYLNEGPRRTALGDGINKETAMSMLKDLAMEGNDFAQGEYDKRKTPTETTRRSSSTERHRERSDKRSLTHDRDIPRKRSRSRSRSWGRDERTHPPPPPNHNRPRHSHRRNPPKERSNPPNYGTLFKTQSKDSHRSHRKRTTKNNERDEGVIGTTAVEEGSVEYWNRERAKLGLKPLDE